MPHTWYILCLRWLVPNIEMQKFSKSESIKCWHTLEESVRREKNTGHQCHFFTKNVLIRPYEINRMFGLAEGLDDGSGGRVIFFFFFTYILYAVY